MDEIYLWNPRGRVTKVSVNRVGDLLGQGYLQPTEKELKRIEAGNLIYSQVYDKGASSLVRKRETLPEKVRIKAQGDVLETEEI